MDRPDDDGELTAFNTAARRPGVDHEPLTLELVERVTLLEMWKIRRQLDLLEQEAPDDYDWMRAIIDRQLWATRFMEVANREKARREAA